MAMLYAARAVSPRSSSVSSDSRSTKRFSRNRGEARGAARGDSGGAARGGAGSAARGRGCSSIWPICSNEARLLRRSSHLHNKNADKNPRLPALRVQCGVMFVTPKPLPRLESGRFRDYERTGEFQT